LGLVEAEDGMVLLVEAAEGLVRVVCPSAWLDIKDRAAAAARIARMFTRLLKRIPGRRSFRPVRIPF
jgi:hypothetical protein